MQLYIEKVTMRRLFKMKERHPQVGHLVRNPTGERGIDQESIRKWLKPKGKKMTVTEGN